MRFELYRDEQDNWRWRLVSKNGKTIADSSEGYRRKVDCLKVLNSIRRNALEAEIKQLD